MSIRDLCATVAALTKSDRACFERIFSISVTYDRPNPSLHACLKLRNLKADIPIIRVSNRWTYEGTSFDPRRQRRAAKVDDNFMHLLHQCQAGGSACFMCREKLQGQEALVNAHCLFLNPPAKFDGYHALILFTEHNPLVYTSPAIAAYLESGMAWAQACYAESQQVDRDPAIYYVFTWNSLDGSLIHGHAQTVLHAHFPAPRLRLLFDASRRYQATGHNYFEDLWRAHHALGLGVDIGSTRVMASLTPLKERECFILAPADVLWEDLARALTLVLHTLQADVPHGLFAFNLAIYFNPLAPVAGWNGFPVLARIVDRGWPLLGVPDIGSMEMYAEGIVASDPFALADALRRRAEVDM